MPCSPRVAFLALAASFFASGATGHAQPGGALLEVEFVPTKRAQIAAWVEDAEGRFLTTLALTHAVATAGIGNRPGALQFNSSYRYPYGRREGVLPVWAHARAGAEDARQFRRVIFQDRLSEGFASRTSSDHSADTYFCLSFEHERATREALDATSCASIFQSDKGRFLTESDEAAGYSEPFDRAEGGRRTLDVVSLYPPRRDLGDGCSPHDRPCNDHPDVADFDDHALEVMPELDAVSRATPAGGSRQTWRFQLPPEWPLDADYVLKLEVNVEGDYNATYNDTAYPAPYAEQPSPDWGPYAIEYGYPYRGQPSVVFAVPFSPASGEAVEVRDPVGHGDLHGLNGDIAPMEGTITDDPVDAPGSGADRLLLGDGGFRVRVRARRLDPCSAPDPDPSCGEACAADADCGPELRCASTGECWSACDGRVPPAVTDLQVERYEDPQRAHTWANLRFHVPESEAPIGDYHVRVVSGSMTLDARTPDPSEPLNPVALDVCAASKGSADNPCLAMRAGEPVQVVLAELAPQTDYTFEVVAEDAECGARGEVARVAFTTPEVVFTTVSPCFVATATYGSPLAGEVGALRRLRDRHLASHGPGRLLVDAYYAHGARLAGWLREHAWARDLVRALLDPVVTLARALAD